MAMKLKSTILRGGWVLRFDSSKKATFALLDVLIEGETIAKVDSCIIAEPGTEIIDATGQIVCPGFVDTHRHLFQSHIRTAVANQTLLEYCGELLMGKVIYYTPQDAYLAQLGGAVEAIHCGVTTVLDHSHVQLSSEHIKQCVKACIDSGLRINYCFAPYILPEAQNPLKFTDNPDVLHKQQVDLFHEMAQETPLGGAANDGRVKLGLGYDGIQYRPIEDTKKLLDFAQERNMTTTFHEVSGYGLSAMSFLRHHSLLNPTMVMSHFSNPSPGDFTAAKAHGVGIACTPESEMQMSHGWPEAFPALRHGCKTGLGVDSSAICSGDLFFAMRLALQTQRARDNEEVAGRGKLPRRLRATVDEVLYMATLGGAEAIHMEAEIGSVEIGKRADVVLIRTDSPCMVASGDFAAAIVMHASPSDVDTVMVSGEVVKRNGKLTRVDWGTLKNQLVESRKELELRWKDVDWDCNTDELAELWQMSAKLE
jgi:cytosine/adenosine deaminase-related metal-dependent hydrolase